MDAAAKLLSTPVSGLDTLGKDKMAELANTTSKKDAEWTASAYWLTCAVADNSPLRDEQEG